MLGVVIFGIRDFAELAYYYLTHDSKYQVVAFCVNEEYIPKERCFRGIPIVAFEEVEYKFSPLDYFFFAPMSPTKMNTYRQKIYNNVKEKGYELISYVSSKATVCNNEIGDNCFILEDNTLQPFARIGNNVILWSGNHIGHHSNIKDNVMFTSQVVLSGHCIVEPNCFFGVNATVRDNCYLAQGTLLAMGACLTKKYTEEWSVYVGSPAKKIENKNSLDLNI